MKKTNKKPEATPKRPNSKRQHAPVKKNMKPEGGSGRESVEKLMRATEKGTTEKPGERGEYADHQLREQSSAHTDCKPS